MLELFRSLTFEWNPYEVYTSRQSCMAQPT